MTSEYILSLAENPGFFYIWENYVSDTDSNLQ